MIFQKIKMRAEADTPEQARIELNLRLNLTVLPLLLNNFLYKYLTRSEAKILFLKKIISQYFLV
jgi:hypothetical protein